ncbi:MAG: DNA adenine methylase [Dehalococcoidales bacterium]|nr:DNA adenine methylase [Dehalococcoidales bacterium]
MTDLKAPFPYFGGKATIAADVWGSLGAVKRYIEPFFGSGAVLLKRPNPQPEADEIVCDKDGFIANVWRAIQFNPDEVAKWCDWPINHADLSARKRELIKYEQRLLENLIADPNWCDPVLAGYWVWAASCWIGSGLTREGQIPHLTGEQGVHGLGKIPHLTGEKGVVDDRIYTWMRELSIRLRYVKVVCGDWTRVCGGNWQDGDGICGIFFDPPYSSDTGRDETLYQAEDLSVAKDVAKWALERGKKSSYRIVLAGYYQEHEWLLKEGWSCKQWSAQGGYSNISSGKNNNRHKEALFMSPYCVGQGVLL